MLSIMGQLYLLVMREKVRMLLRWVINLVVDLFSECVRKVYFYRFVLKKDMDVPEENPSYRRKGQWNSDHTCSCQLLLKLPYANLSSQ